MPRRKPQPAAETAVTTKASSSNHPKWKLPVIIVLFGFILVAALWLSGAFKDIKMGPKIPLVRQAEDFNLGTSLDEIMQKYPTVKKNLRPFNGDAALRIVTLDKLVGATSADLLFYRDKLYFVSVMWQGDQAKGLPIEDWAKQSRRWKVNIGGTNEMLGPGVQLKEWHFNDGTTEMTLRDLKYNDTTQRWQEIRDAANSDAQTAFSKYRLDSSGS